jgi:hypothetical protein
VITFDEIKAMAQDMAVATKDLLVLAPQNDPFYCGTPTDLAQAAWFQKVWMGGGFTHGAHLRRMHYWCISQPAGKQLKMHNGLPYLNTLDCWKYLNQASKRARYLGLVNIANFSDHKAPPPHIEAEYAPYEDLDFSVDLPELTEPDIEVEGSAFSRSNTQAYHIEIWIEKSTMDDILAPICKEYGVNLVVGEGELSITAVYQFIQRVQESQRPARLFYISDFDPAGQSMPRAVARKIEWMLAKYELDADVKVHHLALTGEQVQEYDLPRVPIKDSEKRGAAFEAQHGEGAVELDALEALHPGELGRIVKDALDPYCDRDAAHAAEDLEKELRQAISERVAEITAKFKKPIKALERMREELASIELPNLGDYEPARAEASADDNVLTWLFDSTRSYLDQLQAYREYSGKGKTDDES